jgi:hypothetical protein
MNIKKFFVVGLLSVVFGSMVLANSSSVSVRHDPILVDISSDELYPTALPAFAAGIVVGMVGNAAYDAVKWAAPHVYEWATKIVENADLDSATSSVPSQYAVVMSETALD